MNINLLTDDDVKIVEDGSIRLIVIHVPRADFNMRPVYVGENPYKGTYKRNHEGDYHATEHEIREMIRDQNPEGNDNQIIEYYTMDDIDKETLRKYRQIFEIRNDGHVWNALDDKSFLEKLGGYRKDRKTGVEGLTLAGLLMFGTGQAIRERFDNVFMDYRNESQVTADIRWNDRITYDGTQGGTQDKLQGQIFDMIKENPQISTSEIATKLGIGVRTVKRRIKQMTNIVYVGSGYSGHWEIKE